MIILNVTYRIKQGKRGEFMDAIKALGVQEASKNESGCLVYDYYYAADDSNIVFLNEMWQDEASLIAHTNTPHFGKLGGLKAEFVQSVSITKFEANKL